MTELEDYTYDTTRAVERCHPFHSDAAMDLFIKYYLSVHQFSKEIELSNDNILDICSFFLENGEYVFRNDNKFLFVLNESNNIPEVIAFLKWLFKEMSIAITGTSVILEHPKINLMVEVRKFDMTSFKKNIGELEY